MTEVTRILERVEDVKAAEQLLPLVYDQLRQLAAHKMANEAPGHTLQPTALVHEAWLRLAGSDAPQQWNSSGVVDFASIRPSRFAWKEFCLRWSFLLLNGAL